MTAEEILQWAGNARRGNREYFSNAFYTVTQLKEFLETKDVQVIADEDVILLLEKETELYRLQFFARQAAALEKLPQLLPELNSPLVADLVGREPAAGNQAKVLEAYGFAPYSVFVRMNCKERLAPRADGIERVEPAKLADAPVLHRMISAEFDPLFAHIPAEEEICRAVEKGEITVIRNGEEIAGMAWFEKMNDKYYVLRYFIVRQEFRGRNIAGALMRRHFDATPEDAVYMLWVGTYNKAQYLYQKFGFTYDGLVDHILKYTR